MGVTEVYAVFEAVSAVFEAVSAYPPPLTSEHALHH